MAVGEEGHLPLPAVVGDRGIGAVNATQEPHGRDASGSVNQVASASEGCHAADPEMCNLPFGVLRTVGSDNERTEQEVPLGPQPVAPGLALPSLAMPDGAMPRWAAQCQRDCSGPPCVRTTARS